MTQPSASIAGVVVSPGTSGAGRGSGTSPPDAGPLQVDELWLGRSFGPYLLPTAAGTDTRPTRPTRPVRPVRRLGGTVLPGLVDTHVHLGLVDHTALAGSSVVEVHDLGWLPGAAAGWRADLGASVQVEAAGQFHAAPGGYPAGRPWAPPGAVRAIAGTAQAQEAVAAAVAGGAHTLKVTLHTGGPQLLDDVLRTLVRTAHEAGLSVSAHAEGEGQAARALAVGVDVLVHVPWTETLDPATTCRMAADTTWISTFAIHDGPARTVAIGNAQRFVAAGGCLRYGTDMGNGPTPVGVNEAEIRALAAAGLEGDALLTALTGVGPATRPEGSDQALPMHRLMPRLMPRLLHNPLPRPRTAAECVTWYSTARRLLVVATEVSDR